MNVPNSVIMNTDTTSGKDKKIKNCAVCKIVAKQRCSDCKITYYCSREHQKSDWKSHSTKCRISKLVEDPKIGRCYIATREIEADGVVFWEDEPLLITPQPRMSPVCLNCYLPLNCYNAKSCDKCGWALCKNCNVHGPECELTMKYRKAKMTIHDYSKALPIYNAICVLRALALRDKCPSDYDRLMSLESHCEEMHRDRKVGSMEMSIYEKAKMVKMGMGIDDLDVEKIAKIIGIVDVNGFGVSTLVDHFRTAIFAKPSYVSHDCVPNCSAICSCDDNVPTIIIRAIRKIEKGDLITITYANPYRGTAQRRSILRRTKFFDCKCKRCKDPTELGTMFSAINCFKKDCNGHMLPSTFLISENDTLPDYVCDKCDATKSWTTIDEMMVAIEEEFSEVDQYNVYQLQRFIREQRKILHENHFHMFEAYCKLSAVWAMKIEYNPTCVTEEFLKENIALLKKLIFLNKLLMPSSRGERGSFLLKLYKYARMLECYQPFGQDFQILAINVITSLETGRIMAEALHLLQLEPKNSAGARDLEKYLQSLLHKARSGNAFPRMQ